MCSCETSTDVPTYAALTHQSARDTGTHLNTPQHELPRALVTCGHFVGRQRRFGRAEFVPGDDPEHVGRARLHVAYSVVAEALIGATGVLGFRYPRALEGRLICKKDARAACIPCTPSSKSTFSQHFKANCMSDVVRNGSIIIFHLSKR